MRTHARERAKGVIAADREDMVAGDLDGSNRMVHMSDIREGYEETRSQDFYLEISPRRVGATRTKPTKPEGKATGGGNGPKGDHSDCYGEGAELGGRRDHDSECDWTCNVGQMPEGSGTAHVGLDQVKLVRNETVASHSSSSSSRWERAATLVKDLMDKII